MKVYNTLTREKEEFVPLDPPRVSMYTCGPTVYNYAHIGNLRSYVFADLLKRALEYAGFDVTQVMNITDVGHLTDDADSGEDKMEVGSEREGKSVWDLAGYYTEHFKRDIERLNVLDPDTWCNATEHIQEQIDQIRLIESKGFTYATKDGVYFDTSKLDDYGKLARLNAEELKEGARVDMGEKKHKTDFALWKLTPEGTKRQMEWDSPWGRGFPGWHIECSAMASKYLGEQFDLHTGGIDHVPVHHTNEIAQAEAAYGKRPWVKYWVHGEFLVMDKGKMAKSSGGFLTLKAVEEKGYDPLDYRYLCLTAHYRQQLTFSWEALDTAKASRQRLVNIVDELGDEESRDGSPEKPYEESFSAAITDDLNVPQGLAVLWQALRDDALGAAEKRYLVEKFDKVLGLKLLEERHGMVPDEVTLLADQREAARQAKDFAKADELRKAILEKGYRVDDQKEGYRIKKV